MAKCHDNRRKKKVRNKRAKYERLQRIHNMRYVADKYPDTKLSRCLLWSIQLCLERPHIMPPRKVTSKYEGLIL